MYQTPSHPYTIIYLIEQWLGILSISLYTLLSLRILYRYQRWLKEHYSNITKQSLTWLRTPVLIFSCFWIGWNILTEVDRFVFERALKNFYFLPTFVGLAVVTCWIGFKGYMKAQAEVVAYSRKKAKEPTTLEDPQFRQKLTDLMENQQPYLDPNLDLNTLAGQMEMKPKQVSYLINHTFEMNFYELINRFRVQHFMKRLEAADAKKYTLLGLAFECGFNTKSTFNHVFKKIMGKTPGQIAKEIEKGSEKKHSVV